MKPRLVAIAGPLEGKVFEVADEPLSLGRHASNGVQVRDIEVSRHHAILEPEDGAFTLRDLDSRHGISVNGVPIRARRLAAGDCIALGNAHFLFLDNDADADGPVAAQLDAGSDQPMVGESPGMQRALAEIERAAESDVAVLIRGEPGTGKELAARLLHRWGPRREGPFVVVNCANPAERLLASELFGHEAGAFDPGVAERRGKVEQAEGGSLFLDGVESLSAALQARLLRVLRERGGKPLGSARTRRVDVRFIAATEHDLEAAIRDGSFREDLLHRLNVIPFHLPPLRERRGDISLLASYFAARHGVQLKRPCVRFSPAARRLLERYPWPGNVRELRNAIERALLVGSDSMIHPEDLPEALYEGGAGGDAKSPYLEALRDTKRRLIARTVREARGNYTAAAKALGIQPSALHRLMRNLGLEAVRKKS